MTQKNHKNSFNK